MARHTLNALEEVLRILAEGEKSKYQLYRRTKLSYKGINTIINDLEKNGFIEIKVIPYTGKCNKAIRIKLTQKGFKLLESLR
ncbi:MAG: winged helix-turn-helix domain-containing protein [Nitrososphaerales archaeon]